MWDRLIGRIPSGGVFIYAGLSFVIPWIVYKINKALHRYGDPSWKKDNK